MTDWQKFRKFFPVTDRYIYMNHAGVSPLSNRSANAMRSFLDDTERNGFVNGSEWFETIESCRRSAAKLINADPSEIAFLKNTTQGIIITANGIDWRSGDNVVTTNVEFPANIYPWWRLEDRGVELRMVEEIDKRIPISAIEKAIDDRTRIVTISHVEFASGFRNDIATIGEICNDRDILFFVDAIQSIGAVEVDVEKQKIDFLAADGHKWILGPEGAAIFYASKNKLNKIKNTNIGWASVVDEINFSDYDLTQKPNAERFEEGSYNTIGIFGLNAAIDLLLEIGIDQIQKRIFDLTTRLIDGLRRKNYEVISPVSDESERSGIVIFRSPKLSSDQLFEMLTAVGVIGANRGGGVRLSPHFYNTEAEIESVIDILPN